MTPYCNVLPVNASFSYLDIVRETNSSNNKNIAVTGMFFYYAVVHAGNCSPAV